MCNAQRRPWFFRKICLECLGGKKQGEALEWLEFAAALGHPVAKSVLYRVSKALVRYDERKDAILPHLLETAEHGIRMAVDDLMGVDRKEGEAILQALKVKRRDQCLPEFSTGVAPEKGVIVITNEIGDNMLHRAARCGEVSLFQKFILEDSENRQLLDSQNELGQTPLLLACIAGEFSSAKILLDAGASAAIHDSVGDTPLHWLHTFENSFVSLIATSLMNSGADINAHSGRIEKDEFSQKILAAGTPLHRAAGWNSAEAVRVLLHHGADPLRPNSGQGWSKLSTPLWQACTFHNSKAVKAILTHLTKTKDVVSILNDGDRMEWPFLKPVLDTNYYYLNGGMLGRIARHGEFYHQATEDTIRVLKEHGASMILPATVRRPDVQGHPALSSAILLRCTDIVQMMLDISPETMEQWDPKFRQPPLHFAVQQDRLDIVELLLSRGANPRARNGDGITALANYSNYQSGLEIPRLLLDLGLRYEIPSNGFQTPFFGAVARGSSELAVFVLQRACPEDRNKMINAPCSKGPSFSTDPPGITILGYLLEDCHQSTPRLVHQLFNITDSFHESVDFIVSPGESRTALHVLAAFERRSRNDPVVAAVAEEIVSRYAVADNINFVSKEGRSALWDAVKNLNYGLADCLLRAKGDPNIADDNGVSPSDLLRSQVIHTSKSHEGSTEQTVLESFVRLFQSYGYLLDVEA